MPITPKQIRDRKGRATFEFAGEPVWVEYAAAQVEALTQAQVADWQTQAEACATEEEGKAFVASLVCAFASTWDVWDGEGTPDFPLGKMIPLEVERVATLDTTFLTRVLVEIVRDAAQSKLGGTA